MSDEPKTGKLEPVAWRWPWTVNTTGVAFTANPYEAKAVASTGRTITPLYGPEAAKRIEELEADNARLIGLASQAQHNKNATERLLIDARAALERIAEDAGLHGEKGTSGDGHARCIQIARQALAQPKDIS